MNIPYRFPTRKPKTMVSVPVSLHILRLVFMAAIPEAARVAIGGKPTEEQVMTLHKNAKNVVSNREDKAVDPMLLAVLLMNRFEAKANTQEVPK